MSNFEPHVRQAGAADAATIAALSVQVFLDTYATDGIRPDLALEAFESYSAGAFAIRLQEPARRFLLAEQGTGLIGFAELLIGPLPAPAGGITGAELVRLYIQPRFQHQGNGRRLVEAAERVITVPDLGLSG